MIKKTEKIIGECEMLLLIKIIVELIVMCIVYTYVKIRGALFSI